jgi:Flp pilus assembly protein TadG
MNMKRNDQLKCNNSCGNRLAAAAPRRAPASRERGQAFIEMALILPVLLVLTIGVIEIGRLAYDEIEVTDAARAGAQYGAQILGDAPNNAGITLAAQNDAPDISGGLTVNSVETCGCPGAAPGTAGNCFAAPGCAYPIVYVTVTTTYTFSPLFNYPGISTLIPATLTGVSTMPVQIQ